MDEIMQAELLEGAKRGDQTARYELFADTRDRAYFSAIRYVGSDKDVSGLLKDVYIIAFGRLNEIPLGKTFTQWLDYVVAVKSMNYVRGRKIQLQVQEPFMGFVDSSDLFPESWLEQDEKRMEVLRVLDGLPDGQRLAVSLCYLGGLSITEIAQCMGVNEPAANTHLQLGKNALRTAAYQEMIEGQPPVLTRLFALQGAAVAMPADMAKSIYQEMMIFFMSGGKVPKLVIAAGSSGGDRGDGKGKGKGYIAWIIMIVVVVGACVFYVWNFQRTQKAIGQQLVEQYESSKAAVENEEQDYQSAASEAEPPPPPAQQEDAESSEEEQSEPSGEEDDTAAGSSDESESEPPPPDGENPAGELLIIE